MTTNLFKSKRASGLLYHTILFFLLATTFVIFAEILQDDGYGDYVSRSGTVDDDFSYADTGFFSNYPVFAGLPAWMLTFYGIFGVWGIALFFGWIRGVS